MGYRASQNASTSVNVGECKNIPINETLWVDRAATRAATSYGYYNTVNYMAAFSLTFPLGFTMGSIPLDVDIRMTNVGILRNLGTVQTDNGVSDPAAGGGLTVPQNPPMVYDVDVKKPNCSCTLMTEYAVITTDTDLLAQNVVWKVIFSDGYEIDLGKYWQVLRSEYDVAEGTSIWKFAAISQLVAGDLIATCASHGNTQEISQGCVSVVSTADVNIISGTTLACLPKTNWPKSQFPTSKVRAAIMLENGVYIFMIPTTGEY